MASEPAWKASKLKAGWGGPGARWEGLDADGRGSEAGIGVYREAGGGHCPLLGHSPKRNGCIVTADLASHH